MEVSFLWRDAISQNQRKNSSEHFFSFLAKLLLQVGQGQETICHREAVKTLVEVIKRKSCLSTEPASTI